MATIKDLSVGDVVEITYRLKIGELFEEGFVSSHNYVEGGYYYANKEIVNIDIIQKASPKYKVGDTINRDDYQFLPAGSIVSGGNCWGEFVKAGGAWFDLATGAQIILTTPRQLIALPPSA